MNTEQARSMDARCRRTNVRWLGAGLMLLGLPLAACQQPPAPHAAAHPVEVEAIEGTDLRRVTLTEDAMRRIDLGTIEVREQRVSRSDVLRRVIPQDALIFDPKGRTWVYVRQQPGTFVRHQVDIDYEESGLVVLNDGPPVGAIVASRAVAELYGADFGVGH